MAIIAVAIAMQHKFDARHTLWTFSVCQTWHGRRFATRFMAPPDPCNSVAPPNLLLAERKHGKKE